MKLLKFFAGWYVQVLRAVDCLVNAITLGDSRETVSSVMGKLRAGGHCKLCVVFCGVLNLVFMEKDHCGRSVNTRVGMGTDRNRSPLGDRRRRLGNLVVIAVVLVLVYRQEVWGIVGRIAGMLH